MTNASHPAQAPVLRDSLVRIAEAAGTSPQECPTCGKPANLFVDKGDRWHAWHAGRLFPCAVQVAESLPHS